MRKLKVLPLILACLLIIVSTVEASPDPSSQIRVIPVGTVPNTEPIVTQNPATLMIYSNGHAPITKIWLILVAIQDTYDHLISIEADTVTFSKNDFTKVVEDRIPPEEPSGTYPGCQYDDQYPTGAMKSKLGTSGDIYYAYKEFSISTVTQIPQEFDVEVSITEGAMKVLVLANGYYEPQDQFNDGKHNEKTPWSGSTIIVPELSTMLMVLAPLSAFGIYMLKRRRKGK